MKVTQKHAAPPQLSPWSEGWDPRDPQAPPRLSARLANTPNPPTPPSKNNLADKMSALGKAAGSTQRPIPPVFILQLARDLQTPCSLKARVPECTGRRPCEDLSGRPLHQSWDLQRPSCWTAHRAALQFKAQARQITMDASEDGGLCRAAACASLPEPRAPARPRGP